MYFKCQVCDNDFGLATIFAIAETLLSQVWYRMCHTTVWDSLLCVCRRQSVEVSPRLRYTDTKSVHI